VGVDRASMIITCMWAGCITVPPGRSPAVGSDLPRSPVQCAVETADPLVKRRMVVKRDVCVAGTEGVTPPNQLPGALRTASPNSSHGHRNC
jgi:hypothetical protein